MSIWTQVVGVIEYCTHDKRIDLEWVMRNAPNGSEGGLDVSFAQHEYFATLTVCGALRDFSDKEAIYEWWRTLHCDYGIRMSVLRVRCDMDDHAEIYTTRGSRWPDADDYPTHLFKVLKVERDDSY